MRTVPIDKWREIDLALRHIELEEDVVVLGAVESGSRAWGFSSPNSDWDVRFIYRRRKNDYLSLSYNRTHETIEKKLAGDLDVSGWDIRKALQLALRSNPSLAEWAVSPICYRGKDFMSSIAGLIETSYSLDTLVRAYRSMARGNYVKYIKDREIISYKRYLYVLRPLLMERWMLYHQEIAPMEFDKVRQVPVNVPGFKEQVDELIRSKTSGEEMGKGPRLPVIDGFIEAALIVQCGIKPVSAEASSFLPTYEAFLFALLEAPCPPRL